MRVIDLFRAPREPVITYSMVFYDLPNVGSRRGTILKIHPCIEDDLKGTEIVHAGAYLRPNFNHEHHAKTGLVALDPLKREALRNTVEFWANLGVRLEYLIAKDIDRLIVNDLWTNFFDLCQTLKEKAPKRKRAYKLKIILVSGDDDYVPTLSSLRRRFKPYGEVEVIAYSYREQLSPRLRAFAGYDHIRYIEKIIPRQNRPVRVRTKRKRALAPQGI